MDLFEIQISNVKVQMPNQIQIQNVKEFCLPAAGSNFGL